MDSIFRGATYTWERLIGEYIRYVISGIGIGIGIGIGSVLASVVSVSVALAVSF